MRNKYTEDGPKTELNSGNKTGPFGNLDPIAGRQRGSCVLHLGFGVFGLFFGLLFGANGVRAAEDGLWQKQAPQRRK